VPDVVGMTQAAAAIANAGLAVGDAAMEAPPWLRGM